MRNRNIWYPYKPLVEVPMNRYDEDFSGHFLSYTEVDDAPKLLEMVVCGFIPNEPGINVLRIDHQEKPKSTEFKADIDLKSLPHGNARIDVDFISSKEYPFTQTGFFGVTQDSYVKGPKLSYTYNTNVSNTWGPNGSIFRYNVREYKGDPRFRSFSASYNITKTWESSSYKSDTRSTIGYGGDVFLLDYNSGLAYPIDESGNIKSKKSTLSLRHFYDLILVSNAMADVTGFYGLQNVINLIEISSRILSQRSVQQN